MTNDPNDEPAPPPDGGPAFPIHAAAPGLSKRKWFVGMALQGVLSCDRCMKELDAAAKNKLSGDEELNVQARVTAKTAYFLADAMLAVRGQP